MPSQSLESLSVSKKTSAKTRAKRKGIELVQTHEPDERIEIHHKALEPGTVHSYAWDHMW